MKKRILSVVTVFAVVLSMIGAQAFVVNTKAVPSEKKYESFVSAVKESVEKFHRTHIKDSKGNRTQIDEDYKEIPKSKKKNNLPSKYVAPYTSVKDQNAFGSCWMFGEVASLESHLLFKAGYDEGLVDEDPIDLSEAQGVYTQYNKQTEEGTYDGTPLTISENDVEKHSDNYYGYNEGGWIFDASMAMTADKAAALESDNPYQSRTQSSRGADSRTMSSRAAAQYRLNRFNIESAEGLPEVFTITKQGTMKIRQYDPEARNIWKNKIIENGAISANYYQVLNEEYNHCWGPDADDYVVGPNFWIYDASESRIFNTNHVITVVGFDDNYSKYNFVEKYTTNSYDSLVGEVVYIKDDESGDPDMEFDSNGHLVSIETSSTAREGYSAYIVPKENGAWYIKNSYGTELNGKKKYDNGIMYMSYCEETLSETVSSEVDETMSQINNNSKKYDTTLSHSSLMGQVANFNDDNLKAAEIYTAEPDKDIELKQIGYWTGKTNTVTNLKIYNNLSDTTDPESGTLVYDSGNVTDQYKGYHSVKIDETVTVTHSTSVSVVITQMCDGENSIMVEADYADPSDAYYFYCSNEGDTAYYYEGEWVDSKVVDEEVREQDMTVGNTTVKMFGNSTEVPPEPTTPKQYTVTVDGNETSVEEGSQYQFPDTSENGYATAGFDTLYAPGQTITVNSDITVTSIPAIDFRMLVGASIRKSDPEGIRFVSQATCENEDFFASDNVTFGTILTAKDLYDDIFEEELTLETYEEYKDSDVGKIYNIVNNGGWYLDNVGVYSAGIINMRNVNWNRDLVAQGYITLNYCDNTQKTLYAGVSEPRSILQVAKAIRDAGYPGCTEEEVAFLENIINYCK